jgi:hypothetical protein
MSYPNCGGSKKLGVCRSQKWQVYLNWGPEKRRSGCLLIWIQRMFFLCRYRVGSFIFLLIKMSYYCSLGSTFAY